jgi:hypothetical protein
MSSKKVFAIAGIHFLLSLMAMTAYMGLKLHNPDTDPNGAFKDAIASGLEWIFFFPIIVIFDLTGFSPSSTLLLLSVNTLCWCLIVIPIVVATRCLFRTYVLR